MKALICEMCGGNDLIKQDSLYVCQHCGTKYTTEEAKKLMGAVTIDRSGDLQNLFVLARRARNDNNYANAEKYYSMITQIVPNNWEAAFFHIYFRAMQSKLKETESAAASIEDCIESTCELIKEIEESEEQNNALYTFLNYVINIANFFARCSNNYFNKYCGLDGVLEEHTRWVVAAGYILNKLEYAIKVYFSTNTDAILFVQKEFNKFLSEYYGCYDKQYQVETSKRLNNEILAKEPNYVAPQHPGSNQSGGCYVATAVYGSYDCPEVWTLRRYRDTTLASTWYGRVFIRIYYAVSPIFVKQFGNKDWFKNILKPTLDRKVSNLNNNGVENTPYNDKKW